MALDALRCNHLAPLGFKGLNGTLDTYNQLSKTWHDMTHDAAGQPYMTWCWIISSLLYYSDKMKITRDSETQRHTVEV